MRKWWIIFALSLIFQFILAQHAGAIGKIYGRIPRLVNSPIYNLSILNFEADVTIVEQLATTRVVQEFSNDSWHQLEGVFVFEMPKDARITGLALWKSGERVEYNLKQLDDAREVYQEIIPRPNDELFPTEEAENIFRLRLFPIEAKSEFKIELRYFHLMPANSGALNYTFPLDVAGYTDVPVAAGQITIDIRCQREILQVIAPQALQIETLDLNHRRVLYELEEALPSGDLSVDFQLDTSTRHLTILSCDSLDSMEDKYFTLWITPPDSFFQDTLLVKEIVFVIDHSASMEGNRLNQVKQALNFYLDHLNPVDRFNILTFSNEVGHFRSDLVPASASMVQAAKNFVAQLSADALANFESALVSALGHNFTNWTRRAVVVFTDGKANAGVVDANTILNNVALANTADVSIFPIGISADIQPSLLTSLATRHKGFPFFLKDSDTLATEITRLRPHIMVPVLRDIQVEYPGIQPVDLFPRENGNLIQGVQQVIRGRYQGAGKVNLRLSGNVGATRVEFTESVELGTVQEIQVARLWAASKINYYLEMIQKYGEVDELVEAVVSFSQKYELLTPYTAFILIEPGNGIPDDVTELLHSTPLTRFNLAQNFPNPFNPGTSIRYQLGQGGEMPVKITIFNQAGQLVKNLVETKQAAGQYVVEWKGTNEFGIPVASGLYFYRIETPEFSQTRSMLLIR